MGVNSLPKTVTRQRRGCDLNQGPSAPESSTLTTGLPSHCTERLDFVKAGSHRSATELVEWLLAEGGGGCVLTGQEATIRHVSVYKLLPATSDYITYDGSMTQPGCQETVTWIIVNKPLYISIHHVGYTTALVE